MINTIQISFDGSEPLLLAQTPEIKDKIFCVLDSIDVESINSKIPEGVIKTVSITDADGNTSTYSNYVKACVYAMFQEQLGYVELRPATDDELNPPEETPSKEQADIDYIAMMTGIDLNNY